MHLLLTIFEEKKPLLIILYVEGMVLAVSESLPTDWTGLRRFQRVSQTVTAEHVTTLR